ncbi:HNH endonuclease signature motif containing protein [Brevibacterium spongiae]|uniref:HNH endonuclease n=1 Tax=Brevibacterium spongiae TaxID=2909672 RepID=A0ABY5SVG9_9MICO|nr:HNH endonuclease signature motif containing protein [Brevibacterium spongiae]UVI36709.1 HNH endonuclease [Brevibacterium spongiae]
MKGTTDSTQASAAEAASSDSSLRVTIRFESNMTHFAEAAMVSDRARFEVLESASATVLEQVLLGLDFAVPEGAQPFRCATIAGTLERRHREAQAEYDAEERRRKDAGKTVAGARCVATKDAGSSDATSTEIELYDEEFARAQQVAADKAAALQLPDFPNFTPTSWFAQWVYDNVEADDLVEISTILGTNSARTYRQLSGAMTVFYGLPRFADRVRAGEFTQAHVDVVTQLCATVNFEFLPKLDEFLAAKRADITCETLRRSLAKMISILVPPVAMTEIAAKRRRVDVEGFKDGSACLTVSGPSAEIFACYNRVQAMALTIHGKNKSALNLPVGMAICDERSIDQLQYDLFVRPVPELKVKVVSIDPVTGIQTTDEKSMLDADGELIPGVDTDEGLAEFAKTVGAEPTDADDDSSSKAAGSAFRTADCGDDGDGLGPAEHWVKVRMPTTQWWLSSQAATVATVPFLSLTGDSDLPGTFSDGSPMPAEVARTIAGRSKTIQRILTDPATGTPIDAKATSYQIPNDLRRTLVEQWTVCSVPGCQRKAEKSEIDHVVPFFHLNPLKGGLTRFGNLHPLCKKHHALKTAGRYGVTMPKSGEVDFEFRHGISAKATAPEQPINIAQALELEALAQVHLKRWSLPKSMVPPAPQVLELMPGESTIRARDEAKRLQEELAARQQRLSKAFKAQRLARARLRLERCLDWENSVFQLCLPPGSDPAAMKQLTGDARYAKEVRWARLNHRDLDSISYDPNKPEESDPRNTAETSAATFSGTAQSKAAGAVDPWDHRFVSKKVNWDHDLEADPPPF